MGATRRAVAAALLAAALAWLAWLVIDDAVVGRALATRSPAALAWGPGRADALGAAADRALVSIPGKPDLAGAERLARRALARAPLDARALRDLAVAAAARGRTAEAGRLMDLTAARNRRDYVSHVWRLDERLRARDWPGAAEDADMILRTAPGQLAALGPTLARAVAAGAGPALAARLAGDPPWREAFLVELAARDDPDLDFALLTRLQDGPARPTPVELKAYLDRLTAAGDYQKAYLDWLQFLPRPALRRVRAIYDGAFAGAPGTPPFNWSLGEGLGGSAEFGPAPGRPGETALDVSYDGVSTPDLAGQLLVLAPGVYRFSADVLASDEAAGALAWTLACASSPEPPLAKVLVPAGGGAWRTISATLEVPAEGCPAQWLRLVPAPADRERTIETWFSGLSIRPM